MSRSNLDKPFYVDVGTSIVAVANSAEPTEVWWEFKWIVFNRKEGEVK